RIDIAQDKDIEALQVGPALWKTDQVNAAIGRAKLDKRLAAARQKRGKAKARIVLEKAMEELVFPAPGIFQDQQLILAVQDLHAQRMRLRLFPGCRRD